MSSTMIGFHGVYYVSSAPAAGVFYTSEDVESARLMADGEFFGIEADHAVGWTDVFGRGDTGAMDG